ncbi:MAG TPA: hemerythrin domain-containing protein [Burkholderiales bacterium]|nr:hemerythrin domain-containing protein [Burkholderiales bacterium]
MSLQVPESLKNGHEALRAALKRAMREPGKTGDAARGVARVLEGHLMREEKFALRPLGLLKAIGRGETPAELAEAAKLVHELRKQMPQMIDEHRQIAEALRALAQAAEGEGKPEYVAFAQEMIEHAHVEEDVLYPAAQLVGKYADLVRGD